MSRFLHLASAESSHSQLACNAFWSRSSNKQTGSSHRVAQGSWLHVVAHTSLRMSLWRTEIRNVLEKQKFMSAKLLFWFIKTNEDNNETTS